MMNTRILFLISLMFSINHSCFAQENGKCVSGDCNNGIGVSEFRVGTLNATYKGSFKDGIPNGKGTTNYSNGKKFSGNYSAGGVTDGTGYVYFASDSSSFEGIVVAGKFTGMGTVILSNGEKFVGNYSGGKLNGKGKWTGADHEQYDGNFKDYRFDGYGIYKYETGRVYKGNWSMGKRNGTGELFDDKGVLDYSGEWTDGQMTDPGKSITFWEYSKQLFSRSLFEGQMDYNPKISHEYQLNRDYTLKGRVITHDASDNVCDREFSGTYDPVHHTLHLIYGTIVLHTKKSDGTLYTTFEGSSDAEIFTDPDHPGYFQIKGTDSNGLRFIEYDYH